MSDLANVTERCRTFNKNRQIKSKIAEIDKLFNLLVDKLSNLYPPQVSNLQVVAAFENELKSGKSDVNLSDLKKPDRKEIVIQTEETTR